MQVNEISIVTIDTAKYSPTGKAEAISPTRGSNITICITELMVVKRSTTEAGRQMGWYNYTILPVMMFLVSLLISVANIALGKCCINSACLYKDLSSRTEILDSDS